MPPFGSRKARPSEAPLSEPEPQSEPSAQQRYEALLAERAELEATLASHRAERERLLHQEEVPALGAVTALATQSEAVKLQIEWLDRKLPTLQDAVVQEQRAAWEAAWQSRRPGLAEAQERLAAAITEFHDALHAAHGVFNGAVAFGNRVSNEFVRPFPEESYNRYATTAYLRTVEQRQRPQCAPASPFLVELDPAAGITAEPRFKPRRVPIGEIEAISAIAPPRRVHLLHGPVRTANLQIGIARMFAGETHIVPARAAHALVGSGCAEYLDAETTEPATAAA